MTILSLIVYVYCSAALPRISQTVFTIRPPPSSVPYPIPHLTHSDGLCDTIYQPWIRFLARQQPPIVNAVQSTQVSIWEIGQHFKRHFMKISCLDVRTPMEWMQINLYFHNYHPTWDVREFWLPEPAQQDFWVSGCTYPLVVILESRVNKLGVADQIGRCVTEEEAAADAIEDAKKVIAEDKQDDETDDSVYRWPREVFTRAKLEVVATDILAGSGCVDHPELFFDNVPDHKASWIAQNSEMLIYQKGSDQ